MPYLSPLTCVWEVTMGCNMRCGHCGSSCIDPLPDELTTDEAFNFIDQCEEIGLKWVTLSGGEPTTRKDLIQLVQRFTQKNIVVNMITNGWLPDEDLVTSLKEANIATVAISIDGTELIHDEIRKKGAYKQAMKAFKLLKAVGISTGCVTTVSKANIDILPELKEELIQMGVKSWQLQIGLPMGNLKEKPDWVIDAKQVDDLLLFCYNASREGRITIHPADCIGYYTKMEEEIRQKSFNLSHPVSWNGCNAGTQGFGILHNGDILGCTSIREKEFIEGNIKDRTIADIWNDEESFLWRRQITKSKLKGNCATCNFGSKCLGGCPNTRLTMNGTIYSENQYCSYSLFLDYFKEELQQTDDVVKLQSMLEFLKSKNLFQQCASIIDRLEELDAADASLYEFKGFCDYMCGNYKDCQDANEKALVLNENSPYALKGLGIALHRQGFSEEGVKYIDKAATLTNYEDRDIINDLLIVKREMSQSSTA